MLDLYRSAPIFIGAFLFVSGIAAQEFPAPARIQQAELSDADLLPKEFHRNRREALRSLMEDSSMAVIYSAAHRIRSNDVNYEFHQDPDFYYLTGLREPDALLFLFKNPVEWNGQWVTEVLFLKARDIQKERWTGPTIGPEGAVSSLGLQAACPADTLVHFRLPWDKFRRIYLYAKPTSSPSMQKSVQEKQFVHTDQYSLKEWMARLREIKLPEEIALMRKAITITCEALTEAMKTIEPGDREFNVEAVLQYVFTDGGSEHEGYPSIVGGGHNSCVLHYEANRKTLLAGELLVCDIGAEYHGYTADVTRTIPVSGKFSHEQNLIYNIVYEAQDSAIAHCRPGEDFRAPHKAALAVIQRRLMELGIIKSPGEAIKYFFHGTSHYLGLDVHDPGTFGKLRPASVITVEPGIYIPEGSDCDKRWWNIGVRIEDDILITDGVPEVLSACVPKTIKEIEEIMKKESIFNFRKR